MKNKSSQRGFTLLELFLCIVGFGILAIGIGVVGCRSDLTYSRKVTGMVTSDGHRFTSTANGATEKYALQLSHVEADQKVFDTAGTPNALAVDCTSTRCSTLRNGDCVELACQFDHRWNEPNVIDCKVQRVVDCKDLGIKSAPVPMPAPSASPSIAPPATDFPPEH